MINIAKFRTNILQVMILCCGLAVSVDTMAARNGSVLGYANKCLDVRGPSSSNGTPVQIWDCVGINVPVAQQNWTLNDSGELRVFGNKCLDVRGANSANGTPVQIWDCVGVRNQKWQLDAAGRIRGIAGKCLDVRGPSANNGTPVQIWDCVGVSNQRWSIGRPVDNDADGIADAYEDSLLQKFAPRIWMHSREVYLPVNAEWFVTRSALRFSHNNCNDHEVLAMFAVTPQNLITQRHNGNSRFCRHDQNNVWRSDMSISSGQTGFFLDLDDPYRPGETNRAFWRLYGHVFPDANDSITIQYWQFYAYNNAGTPQRWNINHEGDWEYTSVTINKWRIPQLVKFFRHGNLQSVMPNDVEWVGDHHVTYSSKGSHAQYRKPKGGGCQHDRLGELFQTEFDSCEQGIRWDSWHSDFGGIVNVGEKGKPLNGQDWLEFSGFWGEIGDAAQGGIVDFTSGPIGPAFKGDKWRPET